MAVRRPAGAGRWAKASHRSSSSSTPAARITAARRNTAAYTSSAPAREPVWELAARCPVAVRPALMATTGLTAAAAARTGSSRSPSATDSM